MGRRLLALDKARAEAKRRTEARKRRLERETDRMVEEELGLAIADDVVQDEIAAAVATLTPREQVLERELAEIFGTVISPEEAPVRKRIRLESASESSTSDESQSEPVGEGARTSTPVEDQRPTPRPPSPEVSPVETFIPRPSSTHPSQSTAITSLTDRNRALIKNLESVQCELSTFSCISRHDYHSSYVLS